ncbi:hypothetical protein Abr02nite_65340 [Paractinoplanes brasiliensis]|nr:hypothetical protein Abr02nite_65340 [Actinoplanes brasiliensis]
MAFSVGGVVTGELDGGVSLVAVGPVRGVAFCPLPRRWSAETGVRAAAGASCQVPTGFPLSPAARQVVAPVAPASNTAAHAAIAMPALRRPVFNGTVGNPPFVSFLERMY